MNNYFRYLPQSIPTSFEWVQWLFSQFENVQVSTSISFPRQFKFSRNILPWPVLISDVDKMAASLEKKTITWIWFTVRLAIKTYVKIGKINEFKSKICQLLKRGTPRSSNCWKYNTIVFQFLHSTFNKYLTHLILWFSFILTWICK